MRIIKIILALIIFYPAPKNNYYENDDNTYVDYIKKYENDTYKNHLNKSNKKSN